MHSPLEQDVHPNFACILEEVYSAHFQLHIPPKIFGHYSLKTYLKRDVKILTESGLMTMRKARGVNEAADNKSKSGTKAVHVAFDMDSAVLLVSNGSSTLSEVSSH